MRHEEGVLPCVALGVVVGAVLGEERVERQAELAVGTYSAEEASLRIVVFLVRTRAVEEVLIVVLLAQQLSHLSHAIVGSAVFERLRYGFVLGFEIPRNVSVLLEQTERANVLHLCSLQSLKRQLLVLYEALHGEVGEHDGTGVAHHTVGL